MSKYGKLEDYEEVIMVPSTDILRFGCCDCALVHDIRIRIESDDKAIITFRRQNRATAQLRRYGWGDLQKDNRGKYRLMTYPIIDEKS